MLFRRLRPFLFCTLLLWTAHEPISHADPATSWLARLNLYRATAGLGPAAENPALSSGVWQHARYMVRHDLIKHFEKPGDKFATPEGAAAAASSDLAGSTRPSEPDSWAIDTWMQAPFHAVGILDPGLHEVGFGMYSQADGNIQTAAGIDVVRGRGLPPASVTYPVVWPANGASVPIAAHTSEYPSPLTSCAGYKAPAGLPLIVQLGFGNVVPEHTRSWLYAGTGRTEQIEHCVFDQTSYRNKHRNEQDLGRAILAVRNAIVIVPKHPLTPGASYHAVVSANGRVIEWTFSVGVVGAEPAVPVPATAR
jgi:hypothetical protein